MDSLARQTTSIVDTGRERLVAMGMDIDQMEPEQLEQLRNAINRRLLQLRRTRGLALPELLRLFDEVKQTLEEQGKEWRSLERWQWMDGEIRFWLNPTDQEAYRTGWYAIDDLIAWAHDRGPVVVDFEYDDEAINDIRVTRLPDDLIRRDEPVQLS